MRKVLKDTAECLHYWANQVQPEGKAGSVFFEGPTVYSYGRHFPMARIIAPGVVAFTTRGYSRTTSKHLGLARYAASHLRRVSCYCPTDRPGRNRERAIEDVNSHLAAAEAPRIRENTRTRRKADALRAAEQFNEYLAALPESERGDVQPIDTASLDAVRATMRALEAERAAVTARLIEQRKAELADALAAWRAGERGTAGLYVLPPALRLSLDGNKVQTSHGAEVTVRDAQRAWRLSQLAKLKGRDIEPADAKRPHIGVFRLTRAGADGSLVIGCHLIPGEEVARFAAKYPQLFPVAS